MKSKSKSTIQQQQKLKEPRSRIYGHVPPEYLLAAERLAIRHGCTVAFVITTALADTIGLDAEERFDRLTVAPPRLRRVK